MTESQKERYKRHLMLEDVGEEGQERLLRASVLVIGAGVLARLIAFTWRRALDALGFWTLTSSSSTIYSVKSSTPRRKFTAPRLNPPHARCLP